MLKAQRGPLVLLIAVLCLTGAAQAQSLRDSRRTAIVNAIEKVGPAVVTINVLEIQRPQAVDPFMNEFWRHFGLPYQHPGYQDRAVEGIGTGFIFDEEGHIVTNYHVLQDADLISSVTLPDGRKLDVKVVGFDERTDIAVLKADVPNLPHVQLGDSEDLMVGEWVIAIGNPFGNIMRDPQPSVSVGVISANHRRVSREVGGGDRLYQDLIQTDAAINPGNSGGPLINALGEVVGLNTMIFSNSGGNEGLGFAIPINRVKGVAREIIKYGRRRNPWMGFHGEAVESLTPYSLQQLNVQTPRGVIVTEMLRNAPAYEAGLRLGDVITEVNGQPVSHPTDIDYINWGLFIGDQVELTFNRQGEEHVIRFKIEELAGQ